MSGLRLEDLPPGKLRTAAIAAMARADLARLQPSPAADAEAGVPRRRATTRAPARNTYRCASCGHTETAYSRAERHADTHGGARIDLELKVAQ